MHHLTIPRWLRALEIAKILFEDEGYHTVYLEQIEDYIKKGGDNNGQQRQQSPHQA